MRFVTIRSTGTIVRAAWGGVLLALAGCSSPPPHPAALEAVELLDVLQHDLTRHDPKSYVEFDLGAFRVTRSLGPDQGTLVVRFHLYGVLPSDRQDEFKQQWGKFEKRLRDAVLGIVQRCEQEQLTTPRLGIVKSEVTRQINETLRTRSLRDVVFSELSVERN